MQKTAEGSLYHRRDRGIRDKTKKPVIIAITDFFGAADQIRTGDLILTNRFRSCCKLKLFDTNYCKKHRCINALR